MAVQFSLCSLVSLLDSRADADTDTDTDADTDTDTDTDAALDVPVIFF